MAPEILEVEPRELKFIFELKKQSSCSVQLTNKTEQYVAFKVKTTSPKRYCVRPNAGIILPRATLDFTVTLQAQRVAPSDMQCRDKFLVQSTVVQDGMMEEDMKPELFSKERGKHIEEKKLRVVYVSPPQSPLLQPNNGSLKQVPIMEENVLKEVPVPNGSSLYNEAPALKESVSFKESPAHKETVSVKEANATNGEDLLGVENIHPSHAVKDFEDLKLKINRLECSLHEAEKLIAASRDENSSLVQERDKLHQELKLMRWKGAARVRVGFPFLFVCFIGLVGLVVGYMLCGKCEVKV